MKDPVDKNNNEHPGQSAKQGGLPGLSKTGELPDLLIGSHIPSSLDNGSGLPAFVLGNQRPTTACDDGIPAIPLGDQPPASVGGDGLSAITIGSEAMVISAEDGPVVQSDNAIAPMSLKGGLQQTICSDDMPIVASDAGKRADAGGKSTRGVSLIATDGGLQETIISQDERPDAQNDSRSDAAAAEETTDKLPRPTAANPSSLIDPSVSGDSKAILLNKYRLLDKLGSGGMGIVYKVEHILLTHGKFFAMKMMHPHFAANESNYKRFVREVEVAMSLVHRNIITIREFGLLPNKMPYLVMDFSPGQSLEQILRQEWNCDFARSIYIIRQVLEGLKEAHRCHVIHRDLKPANLLVEKDEHGRDLVKIVDFGLAKLIAETDDMQSVTQGVVGTPMYMSPEQASGERVDHRTDLYAAGLILYEMVTGSRPFQSKSVPQMLIKQISEQPSPPSQVNPKIPARLEGVIVKSLSKKPEHRQQSAEDFLADLDQLGGLDLSTPPAQARSEPRPVAKQPPPAALSQLQLDLSAPARSSGWLWKAALVLAAAAIGWFALHNWQRQPTSQASSEAAQARERQLAEQAAREAAQLRERQLAEQAVREAARLKEQQEAAARQLQSEREHLAQCLHKAQQAEKQKEWQAAWQHIEEALLLAPPEEKTALQERAKTLNRKWTAHQALSGGKSFQKLAFYDNAVSEYRRAIEFDNTLAEAHYLLGEVLYRQGKQGEALSALQEALRQQPQYAEAMEKIGCVLLDQGDLAGAENSFKQALAIKPKFADACFGLGMVASARKDHAVAVDHFTKAAEIDPQWTAPQQNLAIALRKMNRPQQALEIYLKLAQLEPDNPDIPYNMAALYQQGKDRINTLKALRRYVVLEKRPQEQERVAKAKKIIAQLEKEIK